MGKRSGEDRVVKMEEIFGILYARELTTDNETIAHYGIEDEDGKPIFETGVGLSSLAEKMKFNFNQIEDVLRYKNLQETEIELNEVRGREVVTIRRGLNSSELSELAKILTESEGA